MSKLQNERIPKVPAQAESSWPAALTVAAVLVVQLLLERDLSMQPRWLLPGGELAVVLALLIAEPSRRMAILPRWPHVHLIPAAVLSTAIAVTLGYLIDSLIHGSNLPAVRLLADALAVWLSSAVVFSLWYWELDGGGPAARALAPSRHSLDFLFPQQLSPELAPGWRPTYVDYLYLSFTNQTAFSPTDTMPLSRWAKGLMTIQAVISLVVVTLVVSRAVNIILGRARLQDDVDGARDDLASTPPRTGRPPGSSSAPWPSG